MWRIPLFHLYCGEFYRFRLPPLSEHCLTTWVLRKSVDSCYSSFLGVMAASWVTQLAHQLINPPSPLQPGALCEIWRWCIFQKANRQTCFDVSRCYSRKGSEQAVVPELLTSAICLLLCSWTSDCGAGQVSFPLYVKNMDSVQCLLSLWVRFGISLWAMPTYEWDDSSPLTDFQGLGKIKEFDPVSI